MKLPPVPDRVLRSELRRTNVFLRELGAQLGRIPILPQGTSSALTNPNFESLFDDYLKLSGRSPYQKAYGNVLFPLADTSMAPSLYTVAGFTLYDPANSNTVYFSSAGQTVSRWTFPALGTPPQSSIFVAESGAQNLQTKTLGDACKYLFTPGSGGWWNATQTKVAYLGFSSGYPVSTLEGPTLFLPALDGLGNTTDGAFSSAHSWCIVHSNLPAPYVQGSILFGGYGGRELYGLTAGTGGELLQYNIGETIAGCTWSAGGFAITGTFDVTKTKIGMRVIGRSSASINIPDGTLITNVTATTLTVSQALNGTSIGTTVNTFGPIWATIASLSASIDHNSLLNLTVGDVHTQYVYSAGRAGGQIIYGGTSSIDDLELRATTFGASSGNLIFGTSTYNFVNHSLGIGVASPAARLDIASNFLVDTSGQVTANGATHFFGNIAGSTSFIVGIGGASAAWGSVVANAGSVGGQAVFELAAALAPKARFRTTGTETFLGYIGSLSFQDAYNGATIATLSHTGHLRLGDTAVPTHLLELIAGTTAFAPIKFTAGTNLTSAVAGAMEWDGTHLFITQTGPARQTIGFNPSAEPVVISIIDTAYTYYAGLDVGFNILPTTRTDFDQLMGARYVTQIYTAPGLGGTSTVTRFLAGDFFQSVLGDSTDRLTISEYVGFRVLQDCSYSDISQVYGINLTTSGPYTSITAVDVRAINIDSGYWDDSGVTTWYGMYLPAIANPGTVWGLYFVGTMDNAIAGRLSLGSTTAPTALLTLAAGTATAGTAPLCLTSGTVLTTAVAGTIEFTTDNFFATITTGAARKAFILDDGARLTSGKIPIATTNGRLIDGQTPLAGTKVYYVSDTSGGAVTRKLTFTNGILTAET